MPKYHYKQYLNRAFWNSLLAVLCAFVVVLILIYIQEIRSFVMERVGGDDNVPKGEEMDRLEELESLRGEQNVSNEEAARLLEELNTSEDDVSEEEKLLMLESLKTQ